MSAVRADDVILMCQNLSNSQLSNYFKAAPVEGVHACCRARLGPLAVSSAHSPWARLPSSISSLSPIGQTLRRLHLQPTSLS